MRDMQKSKDHLEDLSLPQQRYIEVVGELLSEHGKVRLTDVAGRMAVSLPSASEAVKRLVEMGIASRNADHGIDLTDEGRQIAGQLDRRHQALKRFMVDVMAMASDRADEVACRVEHCVDKEFADRLLDLARFMEKEYPLVLKGIATHVRNKRAAQLDTV